MSIGHAQCTLVNEYVFFVFFSCMSIGIGHAQCTFVNEYVFFVFFSCMSIGHAQWVVSRDVHALGRWRVRAQAQLLKSP